MIISLSDLVWKKVFLCIFHMLTRLERPIIIRIKEYINRPPLWKRSMAQSTSKQDKGPNPVFCLATRDRANCLLGISRVGPAKKVPFLLFCLISFFFFDLELPWCSVLTAGYQNRQDGPTTTVSSLLWLAHVAPKEKTLFL